jgi:hypothetical protein
VARIFCAACNTGVILEQDGRRCSNCKAVLVMPYEERPAPAGKLVRPRKRKK